MPFQIISTLEVSFELARAPSTMSRAVSIQNFAVFLQDAEPLHDHAKLNGVESCLGVLVASASVCFEWRIF